MDRVLQVRFSLAECETWRLIQSRCTPDLFVRHTYKLDIFLSCTLRSHCAEYSAWYFRLIRASTVRYNPTHRHHVSTKTCCARPTNHLPPCTTGPARKTVHCTRLNPRCRSDPSVRLCRPPSIIHSTQAATKDIRSPTTIDSQLIFIPHSRPHYTG